MRLTLGRKVEHNNRHWRVIGDGFDYSDNFGYILSDGDNKIFVKEEELSYNNNYDIKPEDCQLVKCSSSSRTVINHGAFSNDHKRLPWRIGDIIKDRYGNILTVVTRGDIVYYFCARIDSYIYQLPDGNDNIKLGTNATHCSITGKELTDAMEVHTKCGVIYINKRSKPEFVKQSCLSGNWYEPQYFHLVLGKEYENLYVGFDELHLVGNNPDLAICNVTNIPFYIEDERDIVKNTGIHPILVDSLMVTCPISNLCGAKKDMLVGNIGDIMVAVALMPAPIPNNEAVENAKTNYRWPDAVKVAEEHKAHILVSLLGEPDLIEGAKLYTKIVSALTKQENCTGINVLGTVLNPGMYRDFTEYYEENDMFPVENMIFIGLYAVEDNKVSAYTYGMEAFGKKEMEIIASSQNPEDIYYFLQGVADYVITSDVILQDGETIGFSAEQKISITHSKAVAVDGVSVKLGF